mmetsp:Transcript_56540/g.89794  ORF Transcript_56540/g.89794 Transcript_56540/m.89794 type:complete len:244 (-) Transcript_56540:64-795(-)
MAYSMAKFLLLGLLSARVSAQLCPDDPDLDLCWDPMCDADEMDLCSDGMMSSSTIAPTTAPTTTTPTSVYTGSTRISVDATAVQVKDSFEKAMGQLLYNRSIGSSAQEATGFVTAVVSLSSIRRLAWPMSSITRQLATTDFTVTYTIRVPLATATVAQQLLNDVGSNTALLSNEMVSQFSIAGVTSATTVAITSFVTDQNFQDNTNMAVRTAGKLSMALLILMSCFASTQSGVFVFAVGLFGM